MRRRQFTQLIDDLRAELERSSDPAVGVSDIPSLKRTLNRVYETIYDEYDWPHLRQVFDRIPLNAGQRFYDPPADLDFERIEDVVVWWNGEPLCIERTIGFEHYAEHNSEEDERMDPVLRWDVRFVDTREMIEVWPVPASAQYLQFAGIRKFRPLVNDADLCLVDGDIVVLYAAAELAPREKMQMKLAAAQAKLARKRGRSTAGSSRVRLGLGASRSPSRGKVVLRVRG